jgi:hypothetical protein
VAGHIFQAHPVWIYTQSNITNIIFTWVHNTNTEKIINDLSPNITSAPWDVCSFWYSWWIKHTKYHVYCSVIYFQASIFKVWLFVPNFTFPNSQNWHS